MEPIEEYPIIRELDGIYFRVNREDRWVNICWTDLTWKEREEISIDKPLEWWKEMALCLTRTLRDIGDYLDIQKIETGGK